MTREEGAERASVASGLGHGIWYWTRYLIITLLATFVLTEGVARLLTTTTATGLLRTRFREVALLPLRPSEDVVRAALETFSHDRFLETDADLGWNVRRNQTQDKDHTNALGFRAEPDHEYLPAPAEGDVRIVTLGDSFVYCSEVQNHETWQFYLEEGRDDLEVLNLGLPGGGTDQAFLRWRRDGKPFWSHIVVLAIWPDNLFRNLAVVDYYRTMFSLPFTKPRLVLDAEAPARFVNAPIMSREELVSTLSKPEGKPLLEHDFWFEPRDAADSWYRKIRSLALAESVWRRYERKLTYQKLLTGEIPDGIEITVAIAKLFAEEVREAGSTPLILMIPDRTRLDLYTGENRSPLIQRIREEQIDVIDMGPSFGRDVAADGPARYYVNGVGHHSPYGNQVFAAYLEEELRPFIEQARLKGGAPAPAAERSPSRP